MSDQEESKLVPIKNVFESNPEGFNCFGCAVRNSIGLHLQFFKLPAISSSPVPNAARVQTSITFGEQHESFRGVTHGGLVALVIDDVAFWTQLTHTGRLALTSSMSTQYKSPVKTQCETTVIGEIEEVKDKLVRIKVQVLQNNIVSAESHVDYFLADKRVLSKVLGQSEWLEKTFYSKM